MANQNFLGSTNKLFDQALSYTDISPDLALRIRVSNSTYTINFGVKLRDKIHTFTGWRSVHSEHFEGFEVLTPARDYKNRHASILLLLEATAEACASIMSQNSQ